MMVDEQQIILNVVEEISHELSPHHPDPLMSSHLEVELGLGSLERLELVRRLENRLGRSIAEQPIFSARYVSDLVVEIAEAELKTKASLVPRDLPPFAKDTTSLLSALDYQVKEQGDQPAFVLLEQDKEVALPTYAELLLKARRLSAGLKALGVKPGDSVAIMLPTSVDFFVAFYGILNAGAVAVPLCPPRRLDQFEDFLARQDSILTNCGAEVLVALPQFAPLVEVMKTKSSLRVLASVKNLCQASPLPLYEADSGEVALLQYTSGSTGNPKGVCLTHRNLLINIWALGKGFGVRDQDVMISWLPLYHDMGLIGMALLSLVHGNPMVLMNPEQFLGRPVRWLRAFSDYRGSMTAAPNFAYAICAKRVTEEEMQGLDLSTWRMALNGAEPVIPATVRNFNSRFAACGFRETSAFPGYGLAEATLAVSVNPLERGLKTLKIDRDHLLETGEVKPGSDEIASCGFIVDDMEVRIVDDEGLLPEGKQGHLELRGPSVTSGYLGHEPRGEWLRVGDLGFFWEGELYITGRAQDLIIVGGRNIHPNDLEAAIGQIPGVRPGCVAAIGVETDGTQKVVILAEAKKKNSEIGSAIKECVSQLAAISAEVVLLEPRTLPKTPSGKIRRQESKKRYLANALKAPKMSFKTLGKAASVWLKPSPSKVKHLLRSGWGWAVVLKAWAELALFKRDQKQVISRLLKTLGVKVKVEGEPFGAGPLMLVANHSSLLDGLILLSCWEGEPLRFVMAESTAQHPLLRHISKDQLIVRRGLGKADHALQRMVESLQGGSCLGVFPEGGIEHSAGLRGFAIGAYLACSQACSRLQSVAISGSRQVLAQGEWVVYPGEVTVKFLDVVEASEQSFQEAVSLSRQSRAQIAENLTESCWETRLARRD